MSSNDSADLHSFGQGKRRLSNASSRRLSLFKLQSAAEREEPNEPNESTAVTVVPPSDTNLKRRQTIDRKFEKKRRSIVIRSIESADEPDIQVPEVDDVHCEDIGVVHGPPVFIRSELHHHMYKFAMLPIMTGIMLILILVNAVLFILLCIPEIGYRIEWYTSFFNSVILGFYVAEMILKIYAFGSFYFKDNWNLFDMVIVIFGLFDYLATWLIASYQGFRGFLIIRLLQVFRVSQALLAMPILRSIRFISQTKALVETLLKSLKDLAPAWLLMLFFIYVFAVIGESLFGDIDYRFSDLAMSLWTLFELTTGDDWFFIIVDIGQKGNRPYVFAYCFLFIVILCYIFLSLFVAILIDNFYLMLETSKAERRRKVMCRKENTDDDKGDEFLDLLDDSDSSEDNDVGNDAKTISEYYPDVKCEKTLSILERHFQLLASLDYHQHQLDRQHHLLDQLVDMTTIVSD